MGIIKKVSKILFKVLGVLSLLVLLLFVAVWSILKFPAIQNYIVSKAATFVSDKTQTIVSLGSVNIGFPKSIILEKLYLNDKNKDTLIFLERLAIDVDMLALISKKISVSSLTIKGANANIYRSEKSGNFNFNFLIEAFAKPNKTASKNTDTTKTPWEIGLDELQIVNTNVKFLDSVGGTFFFASVQNLELEVEEINIKNKTLHVENIDLEGTKVEFLKTKSSLDTSTRKSSTPWHSITLDGLKLNNVSFNYADSTSSIFFQTALKELEIEDAQMNLASQKINCEKIILLGSDSKFSMTPVQKSLNSKSAKSTQNKGWAIVAERLEMDKNNFEMNANNDVPQPIGVDWKHLRLKDIGADIHSIKYTRDSIEASVKEFKFQDISGFGVQNLIGKLHLYKNEAAVEDFLIETNFSRIEKNIKITFDSLSNIGKSLAVNAHLTNSRLSMKDLLLVQPALAKVDIIQQNSQRTFLVDCEAKGTLQKLIVRKLLFKTESQQTQVFATAKIGNLNDPKNFYWDAIIHDISSKGNEISSLLPTSIIPSAIALPSSFAIKGRTNGNINNINADIALATIDGNAKVNGVLKKIQTNTPEYSMHLSTEQLSIGKILRQEKMLGSVTLTADLKGQGMKPDQAIATLQTKISALELNQYNYKNIDLSAEANRGTIDMNFNIVDSNLVCALKATYVALKGQEQVKANINLKGSDLKALHFTDQNIRLSAVADIELKGLTMPKLNGTVAVSDIRVVKDKKNYTVDSLMFVSINENKKSSMKLNTSVLTASFEGNINVTSVSAAVGQHINRYFKTDMASIKPLDQDQDFEFEIMVNDSPLLYDLILPKLKNYTPAPIKGGFDSKISKLWLQTNIPQINYDGLDIKQFDLNINSDSSALNYSLGFQSLSFSDYHLTNTNINGTVRQNIIQTNWSIIDDKKIERLKMSSQFIHWKDKIYRFKIMEEGLTLGGDRWASQPDNYIEVGGKTININRLKFTKGNEFLSAQSSQNGNQLNIQLNQFYLKNFSQIIEENDSLVRGVVDGSIVFQNLSTQPAFVADVKLLNLSYKKSFVGDLTLIADNKSAGRYTLNAHLAGRGNDVTIGGYLLNSNDGQLIKLDADIKQLQIASIEPFTAGQISNSHGGLQGKVEVRGTTKNPLINGNLKFVNAGMHVTYLNSYLTLKEESLKVDPEGIYFSNFTMRDTLNNTAVLDGNVRMKKFSDFKFDLRLKTDDFLALNTSAVNNKLYFGKIILDSKVNITGTPALPVIKADVALVKGSHFTFAIPESKLSIDKGDGIVEFRVDTSKINPIMLRSEKDSVVSDYKGLDISANIHVDKFSTLKILVDPVAGDSLVAKGDANLNFTLDPSGKTSLTGSYALTDGSYKVSLQEVIKKEFKILSGSTITWSGDPLDAEIDITANYVARTTAADLMGGSRAGADSSALSIPIDFYVVLSMKGQLLKPKLSFKIDIPLASRSIGGGAIYAKLTELNNTESELNKQVFSLLILNRFVPNNTASSGNSGASSIARSSLSRILSDELNKLSAQHVKGVEINFDLQSFNQNANGRQQGNTQLKVGVKKQLLDQRLSIQVGSNVNLEGSGNKQSNMSNLTGDVVLEYKLSPDGRYRLKGFRQNQYDGIANGVITQTGVGIMYRRDFETTKELLSPPKKVKVKKEKQSKE